jgi:hypothetical protein
MKPVKKAIAKKSPRDLISEAENLFANMEGFGEEDQKDPLTDEEEPVAGDLNADIDASGEMSEIEPDMDADFAGGEISDMDNIEGLEGDPSEEVKPALQNAVDAIEDVASALNVELDNIDGIGEDMGEMGGEMGEMGEEGMEDLGAEGLEGEGLGEEGTEDHEGSETPEFEAEEGEEKPEEEALEDEEIKESVYRQIMKEADDTSFVTGGPAKGGGAGFDPGEHTTKTANKHVKVKAPEKDGVKKPEKVVDGSSTSNSAQTGETATAKSDKNVKVASPKDDQSIGGNAENKKPYNVAKDGDETVIGKGAQNKGFGLDKTGWHSTPDKTAKEAFEKRAGDIFEEVFKKSFSLKKKAKKEDEGEEKDEKKGKLPPAPAERQHPAMP